MEHKTYGGTTEIDFFKITHILRENYLVIVTTTLLAILAAFIYIWKTPKTYVSNVNVQVQQPATTLANSSDGRGDDYSSIESLKTIEQNLNSLSLLRRLVERPDLGYSAETLGLPPRSTPYTTDEKAIALAPHVHAELIRGTRLIRIYAIDGNPAQAQRLAEAVVTEYKARLNDEKGALAEETNRVLLDESARQKAKLQKSEEALQAYKESTKAVSLEESQNIIVSYLKDLNTRFAEAQAERLRLESAVGTLAQMTDRSGEKLLGIPAIGSDSAVLEQKKALADAEAGFANLKQRYLPKHPKYMQTESQVAQLRDGLNRAAMSAADRIETTYTAAKATEEKFGISLQEQEKKALELNQMAITYNVLQRDVDSDRALFDAVLKRLKEADASKGFEQDNIRLVDAATMPDHPSKPKKKLVLMGGLLAGLCLGIFLVGTRQLFNTTLNTVDEAEQALHLPVLAAIPTASASSDKKSAFTMINEPDSLTAEAFRSLRTALINTDADASNRVILFTSAVPGEGKTFCAVNHAISLAQQGHNTLLIDADLRLPSLQKLFFEDVPSSGLSDCLLNNETLPSACRKSEIPKLNLLTAGTRLGNASEVLSSPQLKDLIVAASRIFDRVVIDTAPVNAVSDPLLLAGLAQTVCMVVRAGKTPKKALRHAIRMLAEAGHEPTGFILNRISTNAGSGYYYHYGTGKYGTGTYGEKAAA